MQIFEYPYIIITIFVICFLLLLVVGLLLAVKGMKTAGGQEENALSSVSRLESRFEKAGRAREERCMLYIRVSSDHFRSAVSERTVVSEITELLLGAFSDGKDSLLAAHGEKRFLALANWDEARAREVVDAFQAELNQRLLKHGALNLVSVRIGSFFALGTNVDFDVALSRAKQACTLAKTEQIPYVEWNITNGKALEQKTKIENNIEKEIDNNRFFLEYQPLLDATTKTIIGAEVLSRLNSESDGVLAPGSFLSAVSSVGLNDKFDYYIFEKNCKWISNDKKNREGYLYSINFSRSTLCDPEFPERIIEIAGQYDLNFSCLAVEVLEDKNLSETARNQMIENLSKLKERGVSILLDDFGSGFTTFGDLQNLDISIVKIDKTITQNAATETGFIILQNIIRTAKEIGYKTLCEGIETAELEEAAIKAGCDLLQGFYRYRPMSVSALEDLFQKQSGGI